MKGPPRTAPDHGSTPRTKSPLAAQLVISEIAMDMSRFETAGHLVSWAGLCPRNDQSAGERRYTRVKKGAPWLKTVLVQCACPASRTRGSYSQAQFHLIRARRRAKKAFCGVAASLLTIANPMLQNRTVYQDLGQDQFDPLARQKKHVLRLLKLLENLG